MLPVCVLLIMQALLPATLAAAHITRFAADVCGFQPGDTLVTVPASVKRIPPFAFADMDSLREVRFEGNRLREIGEYAFLGCSSLRRLPLPDSVSEMGEGCLRECTSLTTLRVPRALKKLPRFMCEWDSTLKEVVLPPGLVDIGSHAFAYCSSLTGIVIPPRVTHIGSNVFSFCSSLEEISLPVSVVELESYAFSECIALRRAVLPANSSLLGELIFSGCISLMELIELSPVPPAFDCASFIFEPDASALYEQCRLKVLPGCEQKYRSAPGWSLFY